MALAKGLLGNPLVTQLIASLPLLGLATAALRRKAVRVVPSRMAGVAPRHKADSVPLHSATAASRHNMADTAPPHMAVVPAALHSATAALRRKADVVHSHMAGIVLQHKVDSAPLHSSTAASRHNMADIAPLLAVAALQRWDSQTQWMRPQTLERWLA